MVADAPRNGRDGSTGVRRIAPAVAVAEVSLTVSIDTEEDNWGSFCETGATSENIPHLLELHERMARWGARPTYLVNRPPLMASASVEALGQLAARPEVEIGGHCHPWNTPPSTGGGPERSMMCGLPIAANRGKIREVTRRIESELGVRPRTFRTGRWGFGPTVSEALSAEGYLVDSSVSPFVDWSADGGPDYSTAPHRPYRFHPARPFDPDPTGSMVEIPTTIGFTSGDHRRRASLRRAIELSPLRRFKVLGALDKLGVLSRRWLSPETSTADDMVRIVEACLQTGEPALGLTFHSCTLLPGVTPFVQDASDRARFLDAIDAVLRFCAEGRLTFRTLGEVARLVATPTR
ncbi:MAG: hypothetical protein AB7N70_09020 [Dehalococcoidia bacterium]